MKSLLLLFTMAMFCACQSQKAISSQIAASIEDVYSQTWVAGIEGGGAGINFHLMLKTPFPEDVQLKNVVFKEREAQFSKVGDLHYTAAIATKAGGRPDPQGEERNAALPESNRAELHFIKNGKPVVYILENVREKEMLAYPVMNKP